MKKLKFKQRPQRKQQPDSFQYTLPQDAEKAKVEAMSGAVCEVIKHYPHVLRDRGQIEEASRKSLNLLYQASLHGHSQRLTNDFEALCKVYISAYADTYVFFASDYDDKPELLASNKADAERLGDQLYPATVRYFTQKMQGGVL